ncbi:MAG TPA: hypothetical protein VGL70_02340 [Candidatus Binatia bacterium]|jgi:hypothetical protein
MAETPTAKQSKRESIDTYKIWQEKQQIPCVTDFYIEDLKAVEVAPWELLLPGPARAAPWVNRIRGAAQDSFAEVP